MLPQLLPDTPAQERQWSPAARIAFRLAFAWFLLIDLPFPLTMAPQQTGLLLKPFTAMWEAIASFTGRYVFGLKDVALVENGSGDKTVDWIVMFATVVIALFVTIVWSILDRRRENYARLHAWLRVYVRFALAAAMISYGFWKIIPAQFTPPTLFRLTERVGDASPMGILWTLMGASAAYTIFAGLGEVAGGLLLIPRRTVLLGALVSLGVLTNVVMLNFSYDVPVKLFSTALALHAVFLIAPETQRLVDFFVRQRPATLVPAPQLVPRKMAMTLAVLFVAIAVAVPVNDALQQRRRLLKRSPLYGIWNVDEFAVNGTPAPPLVTDNFRWRRMIFHGESGSVVDLMDDSRLRFAMKLDASKKTFTLSPFSNPSVKYTLHYAMPRQGTLLVDGVFEGKPLAVKMHAEDPEKFLLMSRGFHWINETPFNR